jgi:hypothetical protein
MSKKLRFYVDANIEDYLIKEEVVMLKNLINNNQILPAKLTNFNDDVLCYCISDGELLDEVKAIQKKQSSLSKQEQDLILKIKTLYTDAYDKKSKRHIRFFCLYV